MSEGREILGCWNPRFINVKIGSTVNQNTEFYIKFEHPILAIK